MNSKEVDEPGRGIVGTFLFGSELQAVHGAFMVALGPVTPLLPARNKSPSTMENELLIARTRALHAFSTECAAPEA